MYLTKLKHKTFLIISLMILFFQTEAIAQIKEINLSKEKISHKYGLFNSENDSIFIVVHWIKNEFNHDLVFHINDSLLMNTWFQIQQNSPYISYHRPTREMFEDGINRVFNGKFMILKKTQRRIIIYVDFIAKATKIEEKVIINRKLRIKLRKR